MGDVVDNMSKSKCIQETGIGTYIYIYIEYHILVYEWKLFNEQWLYYIHAHLLENNNNNNVEATEKRAKRKQNCL